MGVRSCMQKNSTGVRPDAHGCGSVQKVMHSHILSKLTERFVLFLQNVSNLEAYDCIWTQGTLQTNRVNRYTISTVSCYGGVLTKDVT